VAASNFNLDVVLDGDPYIAARGALGERQTEVLYTPKVHSERINAVGDATLEPVEYATWHRGSGASRNVGVNGMIAYSENGWTCDPGVVMPGPEVTAVDLTGATAAPRPDGIAEADGHIFIAAGRYVFKVTNGQAVSPTPSQDLDLTAGRVGLALRRFGSSLFLTSNNAGALQNLYERPDGGAWTNTALGGSPVQPTGALGRVWWTAGGVTSERLVAQFGTRGIRYCSSVPRDDGSWTPGLPTPAIDIGGVGAITRFVTTLTHLYVSATAGLHDLDSSGLAPNLVPDAESGVLPSGGLAALAASGFLYYSAGYQLYRVVAAGTSYAETQVVTPMIKLPNETPVAGYGTAILQRGEFLIYAQYDPVRDTTWISWGREANQGELGPIVWNVAPIVTHGFKVTALHISGLDSGGPRLWMAGQTLGGAVSAKWAPLAYSTPYADLVSGRSRRFSQTCFVIMPAEDGGDDSIRKDIEEVVAESENLTAGNSIKVSARKEAETTFTQLASFTSGPRSRAQVSNAFLTQRPTFRIDMTGTPASPPVLRRMGVRWLPNPDVREVRRYMFKLGRSEQFGSGSWSGYGADDQVQRLVALASSAARVGMTVDGADLIVRVLKVEGPAEVQEAPSNDTVLAVAVTLSVFGTQPGPTFVWDSGALWDGKHSWA
jgi:hypothetical protein